MIVKAAVVSSKGAKFAIENLEIDEPKRGEVLVQIIAAGICHTDLGARDQYKPVPLPAVLGHEGAGIIKKVGEGVTAFNPGDHVVISLVSCGECKRCVEGKRYACERSYTLNFRGAMPDGTHRLHLGDQTVSHFFGQSSFATYAVVNERSVVKVDKDVPLELLGPLGCGIQTGSGTVFNRLKPSVGSSLVVFGCGTVGLSALMAAKISGCTTIIGVDVHSNRLELAKELGATHTIHAKETDSVEEIKRITGGGVDYSIETSARPEVLRQAVDSLVMYGTAVLIGGAPLGTEVKLDMNHLLYGRNVMGILQGDSIPQVFIPKLIELYRRGDFPFDKLVNFYTLEQINEAVHDMETGKTIKPILKLV